MEGLGLQDHLQDRGTSSAPQQCCSSSNHGIMHHATPSPRAATCSRQPPSEFYVEAQSLFHR